MLVYRKQFTQMLEFFQMLQYYVTTYSINIIARDFNYDFSKVSENKLVDIFTDHVQILNKPTSISGSLIDYVYIKKSLMEEFFTNAKVENIHFPDYVAVRIIIEKNVLDFIKSNMVRL